MIPYVWIDEAQERIAPHIHNTPLSYNKSLDLYIKWENHQVTRSFKARGALNKVLSLQPWERDRGLVAASAGNHGQGVALAGKLVTAPVTIFVSEHAIPAKIEAMRALAIGGNVAGPLTQTLIWATAMLALFIYPALKGYRMSVTRF